MNVKVSNKSLSGEISAISSKSQAHRILIAAALSGDISEVVIGDTSDDIEATKDCLLQLNREVPVFNCRESGSTLRFLMPLSMVLKNKAVFFGESGLHKRPLSPLKEHMSEHGCTFSVTDDEICTIEGSLKGGEFVLPGTIGSQFITGLLFALPLLPESSEILLTSTLYSVSYVTMTLQVLETFGISVEAKYDETGEKEAYTAFRIKGNQKYVSPGSVIVEGDWSNSALWLAAGAISPDKNVSITCRGLNPLSSQGDRKIISLLKAFGANITRCNTDVKAAPGTLHGIEIDATNIPDLIPIVSVVAAVSAGTTKILNAERLRIKESDRLHAIYDNLTKLGADVEEYPDSLIIRGKERLKGGTVSGYNDHRIVMSMAVAALCCEEPVIITEAEAVSKSYPLFFDDFRKLGGEVVVI